MNVHNIDIKKGKVGILGTVVFHDEGGELVTKSEINGKKRHSFNTTGVEDKGNFLCSFINRISDKAFTHILLDGERFDIVDDKKEKQFLTSYKVGNKWVFDEKVTIKTNGFEFDVETKSIASKSSIVPADGLYCKNKSINELLVANNTEWKYVEGGIVAQLTEFMKGYRSIREAMEAKKVSYFRLYGGSRSTRIDPCRGKKPRGSDYLV